jgi:crossover junction endodeoxyribonuclease RusA
VRTYTPEKSASWSTYIRLLAGVQTKSIAWDASDGAFEVELEIFRTKPSRVDIDNILKNVLDALNGVAWPDDRQVVKIVAEYKAGPPGIRITVTRR